jgi:hypothetical protein
VIAPLGRTCVSDHFEPVPILCQVFYMQPVLRFASKRGSQLLFIENSQKPAGVRQKYLLWSTVLVE